MTMSSRIALVLALAVSTSANAGVIVGGSSLIDSNYLSAMEGWLGEGELQLTNIFTKAQGSTAQSFHAAADGNGRTFVVFSATEGNKTAVVGGYNPDSWVSGNGNYASNGTLDAFIFNLSDNVIRRQTDTGPQTLSYSGYGPTFGAGYDLYVDHSLTSGYSYGYSYGANGATSIVTGQSYFDHYGFSVGALEVFTISAAPAAVPEPAMLGLFGLGAIGLGLARRRRA